MWVWLSLKPILKSWQLCLSFKLDVLTTWAPTTERNRDHELLENLASKALPTLASKQGLMCSIVVQENVYHYKSEVNEIPSSLDFLVQLNI